MLCQEETGQVQKGRDREPAEVWEAARAVIGREQAPGAAVFAQPAVPFYRIERDSPAIRFSVPSVVLR